MQHRSYHPMAIILSFYVLSIHEALWAFYSSPPSLILAPMVVIRSTSISSV